MSILDNDFLKKQINLIRMKGKRFIFPQRYDAWDELVVKQAGSLYLLSVVVEKMDALEKGKDYREVESMHELNKNENEYVKHILLYYSKQGPDYFEITTSEVENRIMKTTLNKIREENKQFQAELDSIQKSVLK